LNYNNIPFDFSKKFFLILSPLAQIPGRVPFSGEAPTLHRDRIDGEGSAQLPQAPFD
jgi:hypothetical protein